MPGGSVFHRNVIGLAGCRKPATKVSLDLVWPLVSV